MDVADGRRMNEEGTDRRSVSIKGRNRWCNTHHPPRVSVLILLGFSSLLGLTEAGQAELGGSSSSFSGPTPHPLTKGVVDVSQALN